MSYSITITALAIDDIQDGLEFYNSRVTNLGFRFAHEVDAALQDIAAIPTAYSYRYKNVRGKQLRKFPYVIFFIITDSSHSIEVLRIFNAYQDPFWIDKKP